MGKLTKFAKKIIPAPMIEPLRGLYSRINTIRGDYLERKLIRQAPIKHNKALEKIRHKGAPFNVVFFVLMDSVWKFDYVYHMMERDSRFNPTILVCPVVNFGRENMLRHLHECYKSFKDKGYKVIMSYNNETSRYIDIREDLKPDIIFYTNPYKGLIDNRYYIDNFTDILTCYTNYYFSEGNHFDICCNTPFQNILWKKFVESDYHFKHYQKYQQIKGRNIVTTGYPGIDALIDVNYKPKDIWKVKDRNIKRIIWAPHHTIQNNPEIYYSTFLRHYELILDLANKYKDSIQIAFKPHPILINKLYKIWGIEKTNAYYRQWENLDNGMFCNGSYQDLFLTSDAIMHDSGSFLLEYLVTGKPALHLDNNIPYEKQYNDLAIDALDHYYHASEAEQIEDFIRMIIDDKDPKGPARRQFVQDNLMPPNGKLASENIMDDLISSLCPPNENG